MSSLIDKINEKEQMKHAGYEVQFWRPKPDEIIEGTVTEMGETITENGDAEYLEIESDGGKFMVFMNSVLRKAVIADDIKVGDRIAIKFLGFVQSKKSKWKFKDYVLVKDDAEDSVNPPKGE